MGDRNSRGTGKVKDKMNSDRDVDLKGPSVTHPIMGVRRKDRKESSETFEGLESHTFGGAQTIYYCSLNMEKLELRRDFFPRKTCKPFACKRNYFVLQSETATFTCWRK